MQLGRALHFAVNLDNPVVGWLLFSQALIWIRHQEFPHNTIKGGYRRAEKSRKVLMMMKAAKLG